MFKKILILVSILTTLSCAEGIAQDWIQNAQRPIIVVKTEEDRYLLVDASGRSIQIVRNSVTKLDNILTEFDYQTGDTIFTDAGFVLPREFECE